MRQRGDMTDHRLDIIGREILRLDAELERDPTMGKHRRAEIRTRRHALAWALHTVLTGDPSRPSGAEVEAFLTALGAVDAPKAAGVR